MKLVQKILLALVVTIIMVIPASATTVTIDFEDVSLDCYNQVLNHYPGVTFSSGAQILIRDSCLSSLYWPHSGDKVIYDAEDPIRIDFDNPVSRVSGYFQTYEGFYIEAYDAGDNEIDSFSFTGENLNQEMAPFEVSGLNIAYVILHDHGNQYTVDDLEYDTTDSTIPEFPTMALPVLSVIGLMFMFQRRMGK